MKTFLTAMILAASALASVACSEVSHTTTAKHNWDGSTTVQDTTVTQHPGGEVSVDRETSRTR